MKKVIFKFILEKVNFFIFQKNTRELKNYESLVFEVKKKLMPETVYFQDLTKKLNTFQNLDGVNFCVIHSIIIN